MKYIEHQINETRLIELTDENIVISNVQEFLDLVCNLPSDYIAIRKENLSDDFFDLKTGVAGDILQKISNYNLRLGVIGQFSHYSSKSLNDFIYESNNHKRIVFYESIDEILSVFC